MFFHDKLHCYQMSKCVAKEIGSFLQTLPKGSAFLADQLRRAMASVMLNTAEGNNRKSSKERKRFFVIAKGSAAEVAASLDVAAAYGWIAIKQEQHLKEKLLIITKMLSKLS